MKAKEQYKTLTVEAAKTGWIVREDGKPAEIFIRWEAVVKKMEIELTSKGDPASA
jgi:hypothetical protein